jgi:hypothetical protein
MHLYDYLAEILEGVHCVVQKEKLKNIDKHNTVMPQTGAAYSRIGLTKLQYTVTSC